MTLIKGTNAERLSRSAVVLDLGDLKRQADALLQQAEHDAQEIRVEARRQADELIAAADAKGFAQGEERGLQEGLEKGRAAGRDEAFVKYDQDIAKVIEAGSGALERWEEERVDLLRQAREDVLRFALAVAGKVVLRTVQLDPSVIEDQVAAALTLIGNNSSVAVVVNPDDRPMLEETLPTLLRQIGVSAHADIVEDAALTPGGCVLRTAGGHVDATIEKQLDRIAEALLPDRSAVRPAPHAASEAT